MNKFSINNFVESSDNSEQTNLPIWVVKSSKKVRSAYYIAINTEDDITQRIESGEELNPKERRIVLAQIAAKIGVNRSYLTKRRTPELYDFVSKRNNILKSLWNKKRSKSNKSIISKNDLHDEVEKYKRLYHEELDKNLSSLVSDILQSELYGKSKNIAQKCADLQEENKKLTEEVSNLRSRLRSLTVKSVK